VLGLVMAIVRCHRHVPAGLPTLQVEFAATRRALQHIPIGRISSLALGQLGFGRSRSLRPKRRR